MEDIILQRTTKQPAFEDHQGIEAHRAGSNLRTRLSSLKADSNLSWGRSHTGSLSTSLYCVSIMLLCPMLVVFSWIALEYFGGSLFAALWEALSLGPLDFALRYSPAFSWKATAGYVAWLFFQAALYTYLPGDLSTGQLTLLDIYYNTTRTVYLLGASPTLLLVGQCSLQDSMLPSSQNTGLVF
jgi:hypothetical protein